MLALLAQGNQFAVAHGRVDRLQGGQARQFFIGIRRQATFGFGHAFGVTWGDLLFAGVDAWCELVALRLQRAFVIQHGLLAFIVSAENGGVIERQAIQAHARVGAGVQEAAAERGSRTSIVAISVLTSMDADALASIGVTSPIEEEVARLASLAVGAGSDGIVCSPQEAAQMRALLGPDALIVTPGVRPAGSAVGDQNRIATPAAALKAGASKLVIGRPITGAEDPVAAFEEIVAELCE